MKFADIPDRKNGEKILYSWFNALKAAGERLEELLGGSGTIGELSFTIANNQSSPADVTNLIFDSENVGKAEIDYWVKRVTTGDDGEERTEGGRMIAIFDVGAETWRLVTQAVGPDDSGVVFDIDPTTGQITYTSDDMPGTPSVSKMKFRATTMGV